MAPSEIYEMLYQKALMNHVERTYRQSGITDPRLISAVFAYDDARSFLSNLLCFGMLDRNTFNFVNGTLLKRLDALEAGKDDQRTLNDHAQYIGNGIKIIFERLGERYENNSTGAVSNGGYATTTATDIKSEKRATPIPTDRDHVLHERSEVSLTKTATSTKDPLPSAAASAPRTNKSEKSMPGSWGVPKDLAPEPQATWEATRKARSSTQQDEAARPTRNTLTLRDLARLSRPSTSAKHRPESKIEAVHETASTSQGTRRSTGSPLAATPASGALHTKPSTTSTSATPKTEGKVSDIPKAIEVANVPKPWTVEDKLSWLAGETPDAVELKEETKVEKDLQEDADWEVVVDELEEDFVML